MDHYTAEEQREIAWWMRTVDDWRRYRSKYPGSKAEADDRFIALCAKTDPEHEFSIDTLYRCWKSIKRDDLDGLIDKRGKWKKGKSDIQPEAQHPMMKCYEYMKLLLREEHPDLVADIPSYTTFTERPLYALIGYNRRYTLQNFEYTHFCSLEDMRQEHLRSGKLTCELYGS